MIKTLIKMLAIISLLGVHTTAQSQIKIFGLSWEQEDHKSILKNKGYSCVEEIYKGDEELKCKNNNKELWINEDVMVFQCEVWNGCEKTLREIADAIIKDNIISEMKYYHGTDGKGNRYCGEGDDGDILCVIDVGPLPTFIRLEKANYVSGGMSFD